MRQRQKNAQQSDSLDDALLVAIPRGVEEQAEQDDEEQQVVPEGDMLLEEREGNQAEVVKCEVGNPEKASDAADSAGMDEGTKGYVSRSTHRK